MNDEEWKNMLLWDNRTKYLPEWLVDIYGIADPWPVSEYTKITVLVAIMALTTIVVVFKKKKYKIA